MTTNRSCGIFQGKRTYNIKNAGKGGCDEAGSGIRPVLCGGWDGIGADSAESVCVSVVYYIVHIGRI